MFKTDTARTWTDEDVEHIRQQRRFWARREQEETERKARKVCQRYVKAATICLNYIEGKHGGRPEDFPLELHPQIAAMFALLDLKEIWCGSSVGRTPGS